MTLEKKDDPKEVLRDTDYLDIMDDLLGMVEGQPPHITAIAAITLLYIVSHERGLTKSALIGFLTRRINEDYDKFTLDTVQSAIDQVKRIRRKLQPQKVH